MRLTQPQAVALAHWTPGVAMYRPWYAGGPTETTGRALLARNLIAEDGGGIGRVCRYILTPAGCSALAHLIATEAIVIPAGCVRLHGDGDGQGCGALCYLRVRGRWDMSRVVGIPQHEVRAAVTWALDAEDWWLLSRAQRAAEHVANGGAAMADAP